MDIRIYTNFTIPNSTPQPRKLGGPTTHPTQGPNYARAAWQALVEPYAPAIPAPKDVPIRLNVRLYYHSKTKRGFKTTRPDGDNLLKIIKDAMTRAGFWADDAQVCAENIERYYTNDEDYVDINVFSLKN